MLAKTLDGAEIYYEVFDFSDAWLESETIILHHGLRGNNKVWFGWVPALARNYRVVLMDARGRGGSSVPPPGFDWSMEQFATDALAVVDAVGVDRFHWLGTSFGSAIGEYVAATYGDRLKTLTLVSPPYRFTQLAHVIEKWLEGYETLGAQEFLRRDVRNMFPENADPALMDWHARQMASVPDHVAKEIVAFSATVNLSELLPQIRTPTLILAAAKSDRAPAAEAGYMKQQIPDCELMVFDSPHNITVTMPDECVKAVLGFLTRQSVGS